MSPLDIFGGTKAGPARRPTVCEKIGDRRHYNYTARTRDRGVCNIRPVLTEPVRREAKLMKEQ